MMLRVAVIGLALLFWWQGAATLGDVTFVLTAYGVINGYLRDIGHHVHNIQRSTSDLEELVAFHDEPLGVENRPGATEMTIVRGDIQFDQVRFRYPALDRQVYDALSVRIPAGQRVGLVGRSGSGKTTFVKLVQRLYDLDGGHIAIDGQDIAAVTQESLRRQVAIVQQEPVLFHRSLAENIAYGRPDATTMEIEAAARLAHADDFIDRLPQRYATLVGERGVKLSGGERQRVAIARAFLANAPILILDEATSSSRQRVGGLDPGRHANADAGPHDARHRPPSVDGARTRPHSGLRSRTHRRGRQPCHPAAPHGRHLSPLGRTPGRGPGRRSCGVAQVPSG